MKQAILITAYKNFLQLKQLIDFFDEDFSIYIHIDKKSKITESDKQKLQKTNVKFISQQYNVNWGGINHLKAYLLLATYALEDKNNGYFHLITGQDYPIISGNSFKSRFSNFKDKLPNYIEFFELSKKSWNNSGMDRLEYYHLYDYINVKKEGKWLYRFYNLQKKIKIKRSIPYFFPKLYGGSTYWSLNRDTLHYVMQYTEDNPAFFNRLKFTFCAEEIYFQTIILNSPFKDTVINDNLRYVDWKTGRGGYPAILDKSDFNSIILSDKIFVRKIDNESNELISLLTKAQHQSISL